jgi:Asp-tRNA(Asn)/Glu-tRNA(Gln) amidotransferase B subunit
LCAAAKVQAAGTICIRFAMAGRSTKNVVPTPSTLRTEIRPLCPSTIAFEIERQAAALDAGETLTQDTRGWNEDRGTTYVMRSKEDSHDYRYFPEPDLPPLRVEASWLAAIRAALPELPAARRARYEQELGVSAYDAAVIVAEPQAAELFEATRAAAPDADGKTIANWVTGAFLGLLKADPDAAARITPAELADLVRRIGAGELSGTNAKEVFAAHAADGSSVGAIVERLGFHQISDASAVAAVVAMTSNFLTNNAVTYRDRRLKGARLFTGYLRFCALCGVGLIANVAVADLVHRHAPIWWLAGVAGAAFGAVWNYVSTSLAVW